MYGVYCRHCREYPAKRELSNLRKENVIKLRYGFKYLNIIHISVASVA